LKIRNQKDFVSGLMYIGLGSFFAILARGYQMGTAAKMGSGYFPFWLGVLLATIGAYVAFRSLAISQEDVKLAKVDIPSVLWVTGSTLVFAICLPILGLVTSLFLLVVISAMASHEFSWKGSIINAVFLIGFAYMAFVWGLKLQFPVWPTFI
jgi:Tripartite tricarboxylate transporter TctB family